MTTMQKRIQATCEGHKSNREAVRQERDDFLATAAQGQSVIKPRENELYVLKPDGRTVRFTDDRPVRVSTEG